jgi:hypothetical protein
MFNSVKPFKFDMSKGYKFQYGNIQVYQPVDPYGEERRDEFRRAMKNPYVRRCVNIQARLVAGLGYTTRIAPRGKDMLPDIEQDAFESSQVFVPYLSKLMTWKQVKDWVDKHCQEMKLARAMWWLYYNAVQQGRAVVAMLPFDEMPTQFRTIHPEHTMLPVIDNETGELVGVRVVGIRGRYTNGNILDTRYMVYHYIGENIELFSNYYGETRLDDISDIANNLNIVLKDDYNRAALKTWFQNTVYGVPIPPQEFGNETAVLNNFLTMATDPNSSIVAVPTSVDTSQRGVEIINQQTNPGNTDSLEVIRLGLVKAIIAAFGIPGFMMSEADVGQLGGNTNLSELDNYLNIEIAPERELLEEAIEQQVYDRILCYLFNKDNPDDLPCTIHHQYNKPKMFTLLNPATMIAILNWIKSGLITEEGAREWLGLQEFSPEPSMQPLTPPGAQNPQISPVGKQNNAPSADSESLGGVAGFRKPANDNLPGAGG